MANSKEHYARVLSGVYSWMSGGFDAALERNARFFAGNDVTGPKSSGKAIDLGAGCGFQAIPLAELGFEVTAIDLDAGLLEELRRHAGALEIEAIEDDLLRFGEHVDEDIELAVCMTDTLLHLESKQDVARLFSRVCAAMEPAGRLIMTFRDLTRELEGLDRFIPVRSDNDTILTCFLEYEPNTVKVHDIVYRRDGSGWQCSKSFYRKLRLSSDWVGERLQRAGFADVDASTETGDCTPSGNG